MEFYSINHREEFKTFLCAAIGTDGIECHVWRGCNSPASSLATALLFLSFNSLGVVGVSAGQEVTAMASVLMFAVKEQCRPRVVNQYSFVFCLALKQGPLILLMNGTLCIGWDLPCRHHGYTVVQVLRRDSGESGDSILVLCQVHLCDNSLSCG